MKKAGIAIAAVAILIILGLYFTYSQTDNPDNSNRTVLNVSTEGPINLSDTIKDIRTHPYYEGYDNETLKWMESLGSKEVFHSADEIVMMDSGDSAKLHSEYATDVSITQLFSCKVIERHTLKENSSPKDVLYVKDVEFIKEEIISHDV